MSETNAIHWYAFDWNRTKTATPSVLIFFQIIITLENRAPVFSEKIMDKNRFRACEKIGNSYSYLCRHLLTLGIVHLPEPIYKTLSMHWFSGSLFISAKRHEIDKRKIWKTESNRKNNYRYRKRCCNALFPNTGQIWSSFQHLLYKITY